MLFTVGHSTRSLEDFLQILRAHQIQQLVDVRTIPRSRHNPQFNRDTLGPFLRRHRINYRHVKALGGLRHAQKGSTLNGAWRNASFRGFADYMQTAAFREGLQKLITIAVEKRTVILCAEAVPWRCHRSLIADALTVRGTPVVDIYSLTNAKRHVLTSFAKVRGTQVTYP